MKPVTGFWLNAKEQKIEKVALASLADLQRCVGGPIELAPGHNTAQTLYVDEEGLFKSYPYGFTFGPSSAFVGNGLLLGPVDSQGNTLSCTMHPDIIKIFTTFFTLPLLVKA